MADLILTDARVLTLDTQNTLAEAVAVKDGRIVAVGTNADVLNLQTPETKVVSLGGATLLPGFNDAHCHVLPFGFDLAGVNLSTPPVQNIPDIIALLEAKADTYETGGDVWIRGRGYDQNKLPEKRHPTCHDLDKVGGGKPFVMITQTSGHAMTVNSRVLQQARITRDTLDPPGGTIVRDAQGEPTGVLLENAMLLALDIAPASSQADQIAALGRASQAMHAMGITSATDATTLLTQIAAYRLAAEQGALTVRCALMPPIQQVADGQSMTPEDVRDGLSNPFVKIGPAKLFSDGALTTRTALLRSHYADDESNLGTAMWETDHLNAMILAAHRAGWQIASHAIGDAAIDLCLDAYGRALTAYPRADARHRIEHAMLLWGDQIGRMAHHGILPVYQPEFIKHLGDAYIMGLGLTRADRLMPYQATMAEGLPLIFSSDLPVVPGNPQVGIASAVQRRTPLGETLDAAQCVSVTEGLRAYTSGAAYSVFEEAEKGQIVPGQLADFVVLSADPTALPPDEWPDAIQVQVTLVGGQVVYGEV